MKKLNQFAKQHIILFSIAIILIALFILSLSQDGNGVGVSLIVSNLTGRLPSTLFCLAVMTSLGFVHNTLRWEGLLKGFLSGWALLLVGAAYFLLRLFSSDLSRVFEGLTATVFIAIIFDMLCTGLFEEVLMRGLILQNMRDAWGSSQSALIKSTLISSTLFGLLHLANYMDGLIVATVSQVIYTTFIGVFLCGVYIKSKYNLWTVILLHALFDFLTLFLQQDFIPMLDNSIGGVVDISIGMGLLTVAVTLPLCLLGLRYVKQGTSAH